MHIVRRAGTSAIAVLVAIAALVLGQMPASAQSAGGSAPEETLMTDMIQDLVKNKYKPVRGAEDMADYIAELPQHSESQLEQDLADVRRWKAREAKNYQALFSSRVANLSRAQFDPAISVARMMGWAGEKAESLKQLRRNENEVFRQRYGFTLHDPLLNYTPEEQKIVDQWMKSREHARYEEQEKALIKDYDQRLQDIVKDYKNKTDPNERDIDKLTRETLDRYQQLTAAERAVLAALERIRHPSAPPPEGTTVTARGGSLSVTCGQSEFEMAVGEAVAVELYIEGGTPPYHLTLTDVESNVLLDITINEPGVRFIPVSFKTPGMHTAYVEVRDSANPVNIAKLPLQFRVTSDADQTDEQATQPQTQKPTPTPSPSPPPEETFTPRRLPPGTYNAHLWPGLNLLASLRKTEPFRSYPVPVTVTFDSAGKVTGKAEWKLADADKDPTFKMPGTTASDELTFQLEGTADWTSGTMDLKLLNAKQTRRITHTTSGSPGSVMKSGDDLEYEFTMKGWQLGHPTLSKALVETFTKFPPPEPRDNLEYHGLPQFTTGADGKVTFRDFGWAGNPTITSAGSYATLSPGPGGYSRLNLKKYNSWSEGANLPHKDEDQKPKVAKMWSEYSGWYLKILGQAAPEEPAQPPTLSGRRELVAFGIWPIGTVNAKSGESIKLDAMGVFIEDPFEAVNLSSKVKWELPSGITRGADGTFTASAPGTYDVKVSIRRRDGRVLSDTVRVVVAGK